MLSAIVAISNNNVIGGNNKLLWHLPKDLRRFKNITQDNTIIMGRKTFESLPHILPNRYHIILTRDKNYKVFDDRVKVINSLKDLEVLIKSKKEIFVIGGGEIYSLLLPYTNKIYLTKIHKNFEGDTYFPKLNLEEWEIEKQESGIDEDIHYEFLKLYRKLS